MFVIYSDSWPSALASGQERLLIELWLEMLASDASALYWPPICSTFQTLRSLVTTLQEVEQNILYPYHVRHLAEETRDRLTECSWLNSCYADDLVVLHELLVRLCDIHKKDEKLGNEDERSRQISQQETRKTASSFFRAFLPKVERDGLITQQVDHIKQLTANLTTRFDVLSRAVGELANDLVHLGHSRDYLHGWMLGAVLKQPAAPPMNQTLLDRFETARDLGQPMAGSCEVLFMVAAPAAVPDSDNIRFFDKVPNTFSLRAESPFLKAQKRFAVVNVESSLDRRAATEQAHRHLLRYLHSTRLDHLEFERSVRRIAAVRVASGNTQEVKGSWELPHCKLHNDDLFYAMPKKGRNESTFAELDRVLYWLEQARRWDDVGQLIALWTALEFLFSKTIQPAPESIEDLVPAYLVPNYARSLLLDLWAFIEHAPVTLPPDMEARLEVQATNIGIRRKVNLVKLLEECLQEDTTNPLKAIIAEYPLLLRKYYRVRSLDPTPKQDMPIRRCLNQFEKEITFELRFAFRARNAIVHDAAIQIVQIDRLIQRLNWMLSTAIDTLLFQFVHNPTVSLTDLHEINKLSFDKWKKRLKEKSSAVSLAEIVEPPQPGLSGKK